MYILLDENNYIDTLFSDKDDINAIEIEDYEFEFPIEAYKYENGQITLDEEKKEQYCGRAEILELREQRQTECFDICDRACWYDTLTQEQKDEVKQWRNEWLEVTETRVIPTKPSFIP